MAVVIDILASIIFGGMLLLVLLGANDVAYESLQETHATLIVQEDLTSIIQQIEGEFRNAGSGLPAASASILRADSNAVTFVGDLDGNPATVDTISYDLGSPSELATTPNELDMPLYRTLNSEHRTLTSIVTTLRLRYFDVAGNEIGPLPLAAGRLPEIRTLEITAEVQNSLGVNTGSGRTIYPASMWQQTRLASRNYRR